MDGRRFELVGGCGFQVSCFMFRASGVWFRVSGFGFQVSGFGFRVSGFGFWVSGIGFRVYLAIKSVMYPPRGLSEGYDFWAHTPGTLFVFSAFSTCVVSIGFRKQRAPWEPRFP